jgi:hypothetical protein
MRSKRTEKYAMYYKYIEIEGAETLTDDQLDSIDEYGQDSWIRENSNLSEQELERRRSQWWGGDRFILYPELYASDLNRFLTEELPEQLANYVRRRFKGSTEQITLGKVREVISRLNSSSPNWWHTSQRNKFFLDHFSEAYPNCVDGENRLVPNKSAPIDTPPQIYAEANYKPGFINSYYPGIREFFISLLHSITDTMDSWATRESNSHKAKKAIARVEAKQRRLDRDAAKLKQRQDAVISRSHKIATTLPTQPIPKIPNRPNAIKCSHCGGQMVKTTKSSGNCLGLAIALIIFAIGFFLCFTLVGAIFGIPIMICALFIGGKRTKLWKCRHCAYIYERY